MTHHLLSDGNDDSSFSHSNASLQECKCAVKCTGFCKKINEHVLDHPILMIPNIAYSVVKDLVSILESVRCFRFQYNVSDSLQPVLKRKNDSCDFKEIFPFDVVGANVEVKNDETVNKKMRMEDQSQHVTSGTSVKDVFSTVSQKFAINLGMEDAIENVIRATLDNNRQKSGLSLDKSHAAFSNSQVESSFKYNYFPPSTSVLSQALTSPPIRRGNVISPTLHLQKSSNSMQEQSSRPINQNKYLLKPVNDDYYNQSKDAKTDTINSEKQLPLYEQQEAHNFSSQPQYLPIAHHHAPKASSILRTGSRYHTIDTISKTIVKRVNESMCYQDNQLVHCDRSSVIQHTMQHIKENNSQIRLSEAEMPNQLAVSVNSQIFKTMASNNNPSVHTIPSSNQSNTNASQNWVAVNKSSSSQLVSQTTSSQPWYSEPYPKPHGSRNISSTTIEKSTLKIYLKI